MITDDPSLVADVLVVGAGPAGCAAAATLARDGMDVLLVDRSPFPREKVCGDALIPDAMAALERLGLLGRVLPQARRVHEVRLYAPGGGEARLAGECAVIGRTVLDDLLRRAAIEAGARFLAPYRAVAPLGGPDCCTGARLRHRTNGSHLDVHAPWTILATGAAADALRAFGVGERLAASGTAARIYVQAPAGMSETRNFLALAFRRDLLPGYGWMFPGPQDVFNIGVAAFHDARRRRQRVNLREAMAHFLDTFAPAREVARAAIARTRLVGAPVRTGLAGARFSRPGLLLAGEAAGTTYSLTGEGIGKALETGMLAAATLAEARRRPDSAASVAAAYAARLESTYRDRFAAYQRAQRYAEYAIVGDLLAWRAQAGSLVRAQLEGMFNETTHPTELFSTRGLIRGLFH